MLASLSNGRPEVTTTRFLLDVAGLNALLTTLRREGYLLIGPRVAGNAITYQPIDSVDDLPRGWTATQAPGSYRLARRADAAAFAYGPAFDSLKRYLLPPSEVLWQAHRERGTLTFKPAAYDAPRIAFIGIRPCELEAIARLDRVFLQGDYADPAYGARRAAMFFVAANCVEPAGTCFCASMNSGPRALSRFDLALTEINGVFVAEAGTLRGERAVATLGCAEASQELCDKADGALAAAEMHFRRTVETESLAGDLTAWREHPHWDDVGARCLACGNCTMVCPTCFCHTVEDTSDLSGRQMERRRRWDSCFTGDFSYIHGGSIRPTVRARYRQWVSHKFSAWVEQFGTQGCVGCGRCITWCPVGIDVTEELAHLKG